MRSEELQAIRCRFLEMLKDEAATFEAARWVCQEYFQGIVDEKNLNDGSRTRRAPIGFRLVLPPLSEDDPIRYVAAVRPGIYRSYGSVFIVPEKLEIDVIADKYQKLDDDQVTHKVGAALKLKLTEGKVEHTYFIYQRVLGATARLADSLREWVDNPAAMWTGSSDHCLFCGKSLTDDVSRTRGIGPECLKKYQLLDVISKRRPTEMDSILVS